MINDQYEIDVLDKKILSFITKNARIPFLEVARECNVSGALIHQRINRLTNIGVISGSEFILDPKSIGYHTCAFVGIFLEKANMYIETVKKLEKIPEIVECHYTTGSYAIFTKVYAKTNEDLRLVLVDNIQSIAGVSSTETFISLEQKFKRQVSVSAD
jgi:Lrp/AsnC family transcriptional regulator, regulator for asnA, asnC and gidA